MKDMLIKLDEIDVAVQVTAENHPTDHYMVYVFDSANKCLEQLDTPEWTDGPYKPDAKHLAIAEGMRYVPFVLETRERFG